MDNGNYKVDGGKLRKAGYPDQYPVDYVTQWQGLTIVIENAAGTYRHWTDEETGEEGKRLQLWPYGYVLGSQGIDFDEVDCYLGPNPAAKFVYVIHQMKRPEFTQIDEDKVMLGWDSPAAAKREYLKHFDTPKFFGSMSVLTVEEFIEQVRDTMLNPKIIKSEPVGKLKVWRGPV